jgi:hypothetical protein
MLFLNLFIYLFTIPYYSSFESTGLISSISRYAFISVLISTHIVK